MTTRKRLTKLEGEVKTLEGRADGEEKPEFKNPTITAVSLDAQYVPYRIQQSVYNSWVGSSYVRPARDKTTEVDLKTVVEKLLAILDLEVATVEWSDESRLGGKRVVLIERK